MIDKRIQTTMGLAAGAILLPIVLGLLFGAPAAYYLTAVVLLLAGVVGYSLWQPTTKPKIDPWAGSAKPDPAPEPPRRPSPRSTEFESMLPSSGGDAYRFRITGTVSWLPVEKSTDHADPDALARQAVLARSAAITTRFALIDRERAEQTLEADLGASMPDTSDEIQAWATDLSLEADEKDVDRIRIAENVRKDAEMFDYQRNWEKKVRDYLGADAFATTGSTLVWWLSRNLGRFDESVDRLSTFAQVSAIATGREEPPAESRRNGTSGFRIASGTGRPEDRRPARRLIEDMLPDADNDERGMLAAHLARSADEFGRSDLGDSLRDAFGLQNVGDPYAPGAAANPSSDASGNGVPPEGGSFEDQTPREEHMGDGDSDEDGSQHPRRDDDA